MIDIVIVNWNTGNQLRQCIDSIVDNLESAISRIIVVDNNSNDGSENGIIEKPNVLLLRSRENLGFSKACNLGATHASSDLILFLNPDTLIFPHTFSKVLKFMELEKNSKIGICSIQLYDETGDISHSCSRFPFLFGYINKAIGLSLFFPKLSMPMNEWDHSTSRSVEQVIGAFFLVRRSIFISLNGFDERFFMYFEEVDFSLRAKRLGWISYFFSDAQSFHRGGGSSGQIKSTRLFYHLRSRIKYSIKHFNFWSVAILIILSLIIEPFTRSLNALFFRFSLTLLKETISAYFMLYRWLLKKFAIRYKLN